MAAIIKPISVVLKEARQNKGVSLEEVYKVTKIHPRILRELEDGATLGLSHVYVKSYIKIYAKFLGINQHELDKYFHPVNAKEKKINFDPALISQGEKTDNLSRPGIISKLKLIFINNRFKKILIFVIGFLLLLCIFRLFFSKKNDAAPIKKTKISSSQQSAVAAKPKPLPVAVAATEKKPLVKAGDILRLTIFAEEDTWMQVKVDGKVAFKRILNKGASETWQAKDSFELWLANAGTIKLELNGKILEPIGRRGQLLKSVLINREGLIIKK